MKNISRFVALLLGCLLASSVSATNFDVPGSYGTVQAAVDAAGASGDEVHITVAGSYAGAVNISNKNLSIIADVVGVTITGTITNAGSSVVTLQGLTVTVSGDGLVQSSSGALNVVNCTVTNNSTRGIYQTSSGDVTLNNTNVANSGFDGFNRGGGSGGRLTTLGTCVINNNGRSGIFFEGGSNAVASLAGLTIRNNNVGLWVNSGATGTSISLTNSTILNNPQDQVLLNQKANLTFNGVTMQHTSSPSFAGGVRFDSSAAAAGTSVASFTNCQFITPYTFNCLWVLHKVDLTVSQCTFTGYSTAINVADNANALSTINVSRSTFSGTSSVPVSINGSDANPSHALTMDRCKLVGSASTKFNLLNVVATTANVSNSVFDGGDAQIWSQGTQAYLKAINCTLVGHTNTTTSLNFVNPSAQHLVANCIIDQSYNGIKGASGVTVVNHNNLVRALGNNFVVITPGAATQQNVNPLFVTASTGPGTGDFHLQATSPAINVGDNTLGITTDYDGSSRPAPVATMPDLGAFEEQLSVPVELSSMTLE